MGNWSEGKNFALRIQRSLLQLIKSATGLHNARFPGKLEQPYPDLLCARADLVTAARPEGVSHQEPGVSGEGVRIRFRFKNSEKWGCKGVSQEEKERDKEGEEEEGIRSRRRKREERSRWEGRRRKEEEDERDKEREEEEDEKEVTEEDQKEEEE